MLSRESGKKLNGAVLSFINNNIPAYSPTGRGKDTALIGNAQRDQTVLLGEFERRAFATSTRIFISPNHTICSLDDDLMGTRATDNQLKTISHRKADREGHSADVISDSLFRVVLQVRFHRRLERRRQSVAKLVSSLLENRGEQCLDRLMVAVDRGFAKQYIMEELVSHGVCCIGVMDENSPACHPLVGKSYLTAHREDVSNDPRDQLNGDGTAASAQNTLSEVVVFDRPRTFVIDDAPHLGPAVFKATKNFKPSERPRKEFHAVAVREHGTNKYTKIIRFMHCLPSPFKESLCFWNAVSYEQSFKAYLFNTRDDDGRVPEPNKDSDEHRDQLECHLSEYALALTVGQRCADWFTLREFRVTATEASKIYMNCDDIRDALGYEEKNTTSLSDSELLSKLCKTWFSTKRATEAMMRGTVNEDAVLNCIKHKSYVAALFPVGLIAHKEYPWLAASPDAMCMIDMEFIGETFKRALYQMCVVEIKTSVSSTALNRVGPRATPDLIVCEAGSDVFAEYIPEEHAGQILHQMVVTQVAAALYIAASETEIMYTVLVLCPNDILRYVEQYIAQQTGSILKWTHEAVPCVPSLASEEDMEVMWSRLPFWRCINDHVLENGPFMPVRLFRHSSQTYYSKTRGGVDGSSQWRATFRNASTNFKWEQKVVTTVLKSVTVNAFVTWRMCTKEDLLDSKATFRSLNRYRRALNVWCKLPSYGLSISVCSTYCHTLLAFPYKDQMHHAHHTVHCTFN